MKNVRVFLVLIAVLSGPLASCSEATHKYADGDQVLLWVNSVRPQHNPHETYNYYYLPFCRAHPDEPFQRKWEGLEGVLDGKELINSRLDIRFKQNMTRKMECEQTLSSTSSETFARAAEAQYMYDVFVDDLYSWGYVGQPHAGEQSTSFEESTEPVIFTHKALNIHYNGDRIIEVSLTSTEPVLIVDGQAFDFTYSVAWRPTNVTFERRMDRYHKEVIDHQMHWLSIFNSFVLVLFLTGIVAVILMRTLKKDYARYACQDSFDIEALERDMTEESGWKLVHGDVFRPPEGILWLAALVGTGVQLAVLVTFVVLIAMMGAMIKSRFMLMTTSFACYAVTSVLAGFVSGTIYVRHDGRKWTRCALLTACLLPGIGALCMSFLNTLAILYHSLEAAPFGEIVFVFGSWALVSGPLCVLGSIGAKRYCFLPTNPCRVKRIPSHIPYKPWYLQPIFISLFGGILPFFTIAILVYSSFTSLGMEKVYFLPGFVVLVFIEVIILMVVTSCVSIVGTYLLLNAENYHWQWTSFFTAASTSIYVCVFTIYWFVFHAHMSGFFQTMFFFGYQSLQFVALGIMCGAVGYTAAATFVRRIYRNIKCD